MALSTGILFGLLAFIGYGLSDAVVAVPVRAMDMRRLIFYRNLIIASLLLLAVLLFGAWPTVSALWWFLGIGIVLFGFIPLATYYIAIQRGKLGIIAPIAKSSLLVTVLLAVVFLGESLTVMQTIALCLILFGIILLSVKFDDFKNSDLFSLRHGVPFALLSCLGWGVVFFLFKFITVHFGPLFSALLVESGVLAGATLCLLAAPKERKRLWHLPSGRILTHIIIIAVTTLIGTTSYMYGVSLAPVSIVTALAFSSPIVAVLYGRIALKEQLRPLQYVAGVLVVAGIIMIAV